MRPDSAWKRRPAFRNKPPLHQSGHGFSGRKCKDPLPFSCKKSEKRGRKRKLSGPSGGPKWPSLSLHRGSWRGRRAGTSGFRAGSGGRYPESRSSRSRYSTSEAFLQAIRPKLAVISCAKENRYGHPAPETVQRLERAGCRIFLHDEERGHHPLSGRRKKGLEIGTENSIKIERGDSHEHS